MPSSLRSSPICRVIVVRPYDGRGSSTTGSGHSSVVDFAFLIKMSLEDLVTDADDKLFNLILHSNTMFYTIYFLVVQILIIILGEGVITLC